MSDTIAAIATGLARSAIGILRLSGDDAIHIAASVFRASNGRSLAEARSRELVYGALTAADGSILDWCLATVSRAPNSYTGENTAEFQCHGSPAVLSAGLRALFAAGARQALAGEFTRRAFLNGRLDLTQAEAVIDLIDAQTEAAAKNAASQLGGAVSQRAQRIYGALTDIAAHFHAILDYPDEELEPFTREEFERVLNESARELKLLLDSFGRGRILREGVPSAIVGRPNAGKSSLLNALVGYDRAIVTEVPGTTRDTIEECVTLGGVLLRLTDTAGLRETADPIERIGVERARTAARQAELVLAVFDGSELLNEADMEAIEEASRAKHSIVVINKSDLPRRMDISPLGDRFNRICEVSALDGEGLDRLDAAVSAVFAGELPDPTGEIITSERQAEALARAHASVVSAREALLNGVTPDAVLTEAEAAMSALGELLGKTPREDITDRIFSRFCVGK